MQLNHVHLKSKDASRLIEFYQCYFEMEILDQNEQEVYLGKRKGSWLTISKQSDLDLPLPEWFHFGFCLDSKEAVEGLFNRMKRDGLAFFRELTSFSSEGLTFYVKDPDGNKVEVSWIQKQQSS